MPDQPTDLAILLATVPGRYALSTDGYSYADEIRCRLKLLGFTTTAQQVAARLGRLARQDLAPVETRRRYFREKEYRLTNHGATELRNGLPGIQLITPWRSAA